MNRRLKSTGKSFKGVADELRYQVACQLLDDTSLQLTNLPAGLMTTPGSFLYVTEVFQSHPLITPLDRFGVAVPSTLYSIAYF